MGEAIPVVPPMLLYRETNNAVLPMRDANRVCIAAFVIPQYNMSQEDEPLTPMKLRERSGATQRQIAAVLDVTIGTVSNWERRLKVPNLTLPQVLQLTELYQCSVGELHEAFGPIQVNLTVRELQSILEWCELPLAGLINVLHTSGSTGDSQGGT